MTDPNPGLDPTREATLRRVREELAAMGEDPLGPDEEDAPWDEDESEDVAFVARLHDVAAPLDSSGLDPIAQERVWRAVRGASPSLDGVEGNGQVRGGAGSGGAWTRRAGPWLAAAAVVGLALLVPRIMNRGDGGDGGDPVAGAAAGMGGTETAALGDAARAGLAAIGVDRSPGADAARVRALLAGAGEGGRAG